MSFVYPSPVSASTAPYDRGVLPLEDGHSVHYEQCGNPSGVPVVFLHGGPGSACSPRHRQLFNPAHTRVVLFDQRACGQSTSACGPLHANTTAHLLADMERLRHTLQIPRWLVVGGSWGGGLALAYAIEHPAACLGLVLRAAFLARPCDVHWFFDEARQLLPDAWAELAHHLAHQAHEGLGLRLFDTVLGQDPESALRLALAWHDWERAVEQRGLGSPKLQAPTADQALVLLNKYRIQSHYLRHQCFFPAEGLLHHLACIEHLPVDLVHGRLDWVCRPEASWSIHQRLPQSQMHWVDHAGHGLFEEGMAQTVAQVIDQRVDTLMQGT